MPETRELSPFTVAVQDVILGIPSGAVMSYGAVAAAAGKPGGARQVVRILNARSKAACLPWWRVAGAPRGRHLARIRLSGEGFDEQAARLRAEGLAVGPEGDIDLPEGQARL